MTIHHRSKFYRSGWTPERRAKQAEAIQRWRPWEKSTGPTTPEGKKASAENLFSARLSKLSVKQLIWVSRML